MPPKAALLPKPGTGGAGLPPQACLLFGPSTACLLRCPTLPLHRWALSAVSTCRTAPPCSSRPSWPCWHSPRCCAGRLHWPAHRAASLQAWPAGCSRPAWCRCAAGTPSAMLFRQRVRLQSRRAYRPHPRCAGSRAHPTRPPMAGCRWAQPHSHFSSSSAAPVQF